MNSNRRVLLFVLISVGLFLFLSIFAYIIGPSWIPFRRANLVSDLIIAPPDSIIATDSAEPTIPALVLEERPHEDFTLYHTPRLITDFNADTTQASLTNFLAKLRQLKTTGKGKVRIAYFGDSMIEGDLMTQTLRKLLQAYFGGSGVGFVPITSPVSGFRQTVAASYSDGWYDENFKEGKSRQLYLSGHLFRTSNAWVQMTDHTINDTMDVIEKSLLCGSSTQPITARVDSRPVTLSTPKPVNRIVLASDKKRSIGFALANEQLPVYGISFESEDGVFVDNFSFRGITGIEYARIDSNFLSAIAENNPYDLIVFQYGVNLLFRPHDKNFNWYAKAIMPVLRKLRNCFSSSDFLLVSTADRAFRYNGEYKSAVGIDSLIKVQAALAYETGCSFYNQFASMGGTNSIVEWAGAKPSLANQDYVHPNARGAEILANYFFEAILADYRKLKPDPPMKELPNQ